MSAVNLVIQLVRAHYGGQDTTFRAAAEQLARVTKDPRAKEQLFDAVRRGAQQYRPAKQQQSPERGMALLTPHSDLLMPIVPMRFADLLLDDGLQACIDELVLELQHRDALAERGLRARNRLLFWGPPGNGKTSIAGALGAEVGMESYTVSVAEIVSSYLGGTGPNIQKVFRLMTPNTLVVLDEIDAIGSGRGDTGQAAGKEQNSIVNAILVLLDQHKHGVLVATTNRPDMLDSALLRRFDEQLAFPAPNAMQRAALAARVCAAHGVEPPDVSGLENFDAVTKACLTVARRHAMAEILRLDSSEQENEDGQEEITKH